MALAQSTVTRRTSPPTHGGSVPLALCLSPIRVSLPCFSCPTVSLSSRSLTIHHWIPSPARPRVAVVPRRPCVPCPPCAVRTRRTRRSARQVPVSYHRTCAALSLALHTRRPCRGPHPARASVVLLCIAPLPRAFSQRRQPASLPASSPLLLPLRERRLRLLPAARGSTSDRAASPPRTARPAASRGRSLAGAGRADGPHRSRSARITLRKVGGVMWVGAWVQAGRGVWGTLGTYGGGEPGVGARRGSAVVTVAWEMTGPCMVCAVPARLYAVS